METFRERIIPSWGRGVDKSGRRNTMKRLRIPLVIVLLVVAGRTFDAGAQTKTNLHSFGSVPNDGNTPYAGLVQGSDGNFYGTTFEGGTSTNCDGGCGTVFRISPSGTYTALYSFVGYPSDGFYPRAGLMQGSDSNFYGTTEGGGTYNNGTVFRVSPSGSETNLYSFLGSPTDGATPYAGLVQGSNGDFYGTTYAGGTNGLGTVFRISPSGSETNLYSFGGFPDGYNPEAGLVQGSDGNFFGTTLTGGTNYGDGTVFRISPSGSYTSLYSFTSSGGAEPAAGLVLGSDGNFYGTTVYGGMTNNEGTVFLISPSGNLTNLYWFGGVPNDGNGPEGGLVQGSDGNFYGTTFFGGTSTNCAGGCGTVFRISPRGIYTSLYSFLGSPTDGAWPNAGLVQGSDGNFYGTTYKGGSNGVGTVFRISVPLNPPANQISRIQKSGTNVIFAIPSVAGETYQLQYRNSMTSGIWSNVPGESVTNSIGSILTLTNFAGANQPQGFYRFAITP
jgi:uncharacterized repeat protein (TIGR03803 family)